MRIMAVCHWIVAVWCWRRCTAEMPCAGISGRVCCPTIRNWMPLCRALPPSGASTVESHFRPKDAPCTAPIAAGMKPRNIRLRSGFRSTAETRGPHKVGWALWGEEVQRNERGLPSAAGRGIWSLYRRCNDLSWKSVAAQHVFCLIFRRWCICIRNAVLHNCALQGTLRKQG